MCLLNVLWEAKWKNSQTEGSKTQHLRTNRDWLHQCTEYTWNRGWLNGDRLELTPDRSAHLSTFIWEASNCSRWWRTQSIAWQDGATSVGSLSSYEDINAVMEAPPSRLYPSQWLPNGSSSTDINTQCQGLNFSMSLGGTNSRGSHVLNCHEQLRFWTLLLLLMSPPKPWAFRVRIWDTP